MNIQQVIVSVPMLPLLAALVVGLFGRRIGRQASAATAILAVGASLVLSVVIARKIFNTGVVINFDWYQWVVAGDLSLAVGFMIDGLTSVMMVVVTFVSLMVHIYTMGYMKDDAGYQRFFSYIALFTFAMLMLVMANNFMQLFFGWEAVGLVSYLLIGFWFTRPSAVHANLKAFLVNRVGDFGFLIGIGLILAQLGSLDYAQVFAERERLADGSIPLWGDISWPVATVAAIALFIGAMGKSAQFPLHVWLPDSMEGPTPISALIHAATMVTAGIFMVARMSPLFEMSDTALTVVLIVGGITAFSMALLGLVQHDIKRVVAYSTLSQLGYMTAALGASAYSAAIFHLATHAFFKALLFLGAGSVIVALHHQQDMRQMGGLMRRMPITYATALIGSLALCGIPPLAGFFSKDAIIEAVGHASLPGAAAVHFALIAAAFVTSFYSFRLLALVFHGGYRGSAESFDHVRESPWQITLPLVVLAVPSLVAGWLLLEPMLLAGDWLAGSIFLAEGRDPLAALREIVSSPAEMVRHAVVTPVFYAAGAGMVLAFAIYTMFPGLPASIAAGCGPVYRVLLAKYGCDEFNELVFARGARRIGRALWRGIDVTVIDGIINGGAGMVAAVARSTRSLQSGRFYHYAFVMIIFLAGLAAWLLGGR
ncbi:MAG: NADH-quinone oxidoreductase subunit L [Betaproteobacteria bacterium]|nr:NADH-quinone oxidoreductase subunit L [Betaproteobacteria bacterium]